LQLANWSDAKRVVETDTLYAIPQLDVRPDIPTPTQKFRGETLVQDWVDTEETIECLGKKVPYVRFPYTDQPDAPVAFSNGRGAQELHWARTELAFLEHAGLPIMLRFFVEGTVSDIDAQLKGSATKTVPCRAYTNGDERVGIDNSWATLLLVPESQLEGSAKYLLTVKCKVNGTAFEKSWSFSTRAK
jgi:hypothetical protein